MSFNENIIEWVEEFLLEAPAAFPYEIQAGELRETGIDGSDRFVCFYRDGGRQTGPANKFPRVKLWIYSEREAELVDGAISRTGDLAEALDAYATKLPTMCAFISTRVLGGIIGPKFTENGRAAYGLTVEFII